MSDSTQQLQQESQEEEQPIEGQDTVTPSEDPFEAYRRESEERIARLSTMVTNLAGTIQDQTQAINSLSQQRQAPPPANPDADFEDVPEFMRDQVRHTVNAVQKRINSSVAPLNEAVAKMQRSEAIGGLQQQIANNPQYAAVYAQAKEDIDQALSSLTVFNPQTIHAAVVYGYGQASIAGRIKAPSNQNQPQTPIVQNPTVPNAPIQRPTNTRQAPVRKLTELDRSIMKRWGIKSEAAYWQFVDSDGSIDSLTAIEDK